PRSQIPCPAAACRGRSGPVLPQRRRPSPPPPRRSSCRGRKPNPTLPAVGPAARRELAERDFGADAPRRPPPCHCLRRHPVDVVPSNEAQRLEPAPPPRIERRLANDGEEPGSHRGPTVVARSSIQNFEVRRLQHVLGLLTPKATARQRPAVARRVKP